MKKNRAIYQLKVQLRDIDPPIWRRVQVWEDISLGGLHRVLQVVMGWEDCHLHDFVIGRRTYSVPDPDDDFNERKVLDERRVRLKAVAGRVGFEFTYIYDFGDDWQHDLIVEAMLLPEPGAKYPRCIDGRRRGPPEDVGGARGYAEYLSVLADPGHEEHEAMLRWRGPFDPEAFDLHRVNEELRPKARSVRAPVSRAEPTRDKVSAEAEGFARGMLELLQGSVMTPGRKKRIRPDEKVPIELDERERALIVQHSLAEPELTKRLLVVPKPGAALVYHYTLDELDELAGYVAFEANHAKNAKARREWDRLFGRIWDVLDSYTDE